MMMLGRFTDSGNSATDGVDSRTPKKRPRPVLSCFECRRKKLKCDRLLPCNQCKKSGRTARCSYTAQDNSSDAVDTDAYIWGKRVLLTDLRHEKEGREQERGRGDDVTREDSGANVLIDPGIVHDVEDLKARVAKLENRLSENSRPRDLDPQAAAEQTTPPSVVLQDPLSMLRDLQMSNLGILVTKGNRSRYHTSDQKLPMLFIFEEGMQIIQGLSKNPAVARVMKEVKLARKVQAAKLKSKKEISLNNLCSISGVLRASLPPRHVCEKLTSIYFDSCEKLLKILHRPTFLFKCKAFWESENVPHKRHPVVDDAFLSHLVAVVIIASVLCKMGTTLTGAELQIVESLSLDGLCEVLRSWINALNPKRRLELSTVQTRCLLLLAQQMIPTQSEFLGDDSAILVRSAMTMGLHRDPRDFSTVTVFEGELRRRLWMTVVELDMQISYESGGYSMVRDGDFSTLPSTRLEDDEIFEDLKDLPLANTPKTPIESRKVDVDRHFYAILASDVQQRLKVVSFTASRAFCLANSEEVLNQGRKLQAIRTNLKERLRYLTETWAVPLVQSEILNSTLLYVYTVRPLLSMYRRHIFSEPENSASIKMEKTCVESSLDILSFLEILEPVNHAMDSGSVSLDLFHVICKTDIMQAALTLCLAAKKMDESSPNLCIYRCINGDKVWSRTDLINRVHTTAERLLHRKQEPIHDVRDSLCLTVVAEYLTHQDNQRLRDVMMNTAAFKTINSYLETLRQSTAKSNFGANFEFKLISPETSSEDYVALSPNEMMHINEVDVDQYTNLGNNEFDMDDFLDFGFSDTWNWQQGWP